MSTKRKVPQKLGLPVVKQSAKLLGNGRLDQSKTVVTGGGNPLKSNPNRSYDVVDISSDSSSDDDARDDEESAAEESVEGEDVAMEDAELSEGPPTPEGLAEAGEASFGDLVRATVSEPIDVAGAFEDATSQVMAFPQPKLQAPSGASLGTVLSQALRTSDLSLLESCLRTPDTDIIRATIQRLESPLAGKLISRLAERLHKRPGRAGSLMVWIQWTLTTHGGYLATQPDLVKRLAALNEVIGARTRGLQSVLALKGKLDMLESQMTLRRHMQNQRKRLDEEDDDEGVIYVEGQESDVDEQGANLGALTRNGDLGSVSGESEDMAMINGVMAESDDDDEDDSSNDELIDDEAEETDDDSGDEDEVDHDDQDSLEDEEESNDDAQAPPPSKMQRIRGPFLKKI